MKLKYQLLDSRDIIWMCNILKRLLIKISPYFEWVLFASTYGWFQDTYTVYFYDYMFHIQYVNIKLHSYAL